MLKILVTGVNGFVGKHVVRELKQRGYKVVGLGNSGPAHPEIKDSLEAYHLCDLGDADQVAALPLQDINAVINLAGLANVGASFDAAETYKRINVAVLENLGNCLRNMNSKARMIAVSTGAVYASNQPLPLTERSRTVTDGSPYAQSKLLMEDAAKALRKKGLEVAIVRPFNHIGPGQGEGFLVPDLYKKLLAFKVAGEPVRVGNLHTKRDYTDVRDIAKAYADLAVSQSLDFDTYNICSGASHSGQEILNTFLKEMGLEEKVKIEQDPQLVRPNDPPELVGSHHRLTEETGWEPTIPLKETIHDFVASK
jgi:GDP-4-dehydro-6-deoxy-D-mannose reductase